MLQVIRAIILISALAMAASCGSRGQANAPNWSSLIAASGKSGLAAAGPSATRVTSVEDMERVGSFRFVFPSYLPPGMGEVQLDASADTGGLSGGPLRWEQVAITPPPRNDSPIISIREEDLTTCSSPPCFDGREIYLNASNETIDNTKIHCDTDSFLSQLECYWKTEDKWFDVTFTWGGNEPTPTADAREQAMKVVESMISAPTHP